MIRIIRVPSPYDRDINECCVIKHPNPNLREEWLAVYNMKTGEFKLDEKSAVKRYSMKHLASAGFEASEDSAWIRETSHGTSPSYGPYAET